MKLFAALGLGAGVQAVERCPLFAEKGWKLVRRTTDDAFTNGDLMAGTLVFGQQHQQMKGSSFAMDITNYDYNRIMFMTADCTKWVQTTKDQFTNGWGENESILVSGTSEGLSDQSINVSEGVMTTSNFDGAEGCNIVYSESADAPGCSTNDDGQSNSAQNQGYNVYIWTTGELDDEEGGAAAALPYQSVEYDDVVSQTVCFSDVTDFDGVRDRCAVYTGPDGNDAPGDWIPYSVRDANDRATFQNTLHGNNGCDANSDMWWGLTDDHDGTQDSKGQTCAAEGDWVDWWGNKVNYQGGLGGWVGGNGLDDHGSGEDCAEGSANGNLNDHQCSQQRQYGCMPKWKGFDGPGIGMCPLASVIPWDECDRTRCRAWGDPHVDGFDGNRNDVYGGGWYQLAGTTPYARENLGLPNFLVAMETRQERHVAYIKKTKIVFPSNTGQSTYTITFTEHGDASISLNGGADLKLDSQDNSNFRFAKNGRDLSIETWLGVQMSLRGVDATIDVPTYFSSDGVGQDRTYGICGNLNCQAIDDWTLKDGTPCTEGAASGSGGYKRTECEFKAANSFILNPDEAIIGDLNPPDDLAECTEDITNRCETMFDDAAFAQCVAVVTDEDGNNKWIENCKADICIWPDVVEEQDKVIDSVRNNMVDECTQNRNPNEVTTQSLCNLPSANVCTEPNTEWKNCATCNDRKTCAEEMNLVASTCDDSAGTIGMCTCQGDFRLDERGNCVHKNDCVAPKVEYSQWSEWGACSVSCGGGGQATRSRICLGGSTCVGDAEETRMNVCGKQDCPKVKECTDLSDNCEGFESGFEDPITGETQTIVMKVPIPDPDAITVQSVPGEDPPVPTLTINGVDTTSFNPNTQEFTYPDPVTGEERVLRINTLNQGVIFEDGQTISRVDDDECNVQNNVDTCTDLLMHDQLLCTNGDGLSVCNVQAEDIHTHNCKEYISSTVAAWPDMDNVSAKAKCREEGGRLMRLTSMADVKFLSQAAGTDTMTDPYDMHAVCAEDSTVEGVWKSYDVAIDINLWSADKPTTGADADGMDCSHLVLEQANDPATDRYRLVDYDCADLRPFICERPRTAQNTGIGSWKYDQQDTCNHWIDCKDGRPTMVDQEIKLNPNESATPTYDNELFSITKSDGTTTVGNQQGDIITVEQGGLNGDNWIGTISKAFSERCIQETLDEYCNKLGVTDDQTVPAEHASYEDYNYARWSEGAQMWTCYQNIITGSVTGARSVTCVDNNGVLTECQAANDGADQVLFDDTRVHKTMTEIIRHHVEYGCKRMDKIEFVAPKEVLVRCQAGCEPEYRYTRPSKCNMCEETGMTKEYGCAYFKDDGANLISSQDASDWETCTELCMGDPACESAYWEENLTTCNLIKESFDTADKTCSHTDLIGGRKCHAERECEPLVCDMCAEHGFTFNEGCTYSNADNMDSNERVLNVASYEACVSLCKNTDECNGVTFFTKYYGSANILPQSDVTTALDTDGDGPMLCVLKKTTDSGLTCNGAEQYQEVVSGEPCTTMIADADAKFTGETVCNHLCDTCYVRNAAGVMDGLAKTKEYDCVHDGGSIEVQPSQTSWEDCLALCEGHSSCTHVRYTPSTSTAVDFTDDRGVTPAANDCELFESSFQETRTCNPNTVGQITARLCSEEPLCHVGCGDIDECGGEALNDCTNIATAGGFSDDFTCSNTIGSYTCDRGAGTLAPNTEAWSEDGNGGDGLTPWTDDSGNEWTFVKGTNEAGEEIVTITGLDTAAVNGVINGNEIIVPDPTNPENPRIGTISPDGKTITWTQNGGLIITTGRADIDECTSDPANDPCSAQTGTTCYNTEPGFSCNCDIGTDGKTEWSFVDDVTGNTVTVQVSIDSATQSKATITYTMSDGTTATGSLLGSTIEFMNADGTLMKTGTITKNADGSENIAWDVGPGWGRTANGTVNPITQAPVTSAPVVGSPVTTAPVVGPVTPAPDTQAPVTSAPVTQNGSQITAASGVATGDPHFRIHFGRATDICFDMSGHDGTVFNLLHEPSSGLVINGQIVDTVYKAKHAHRLAKIGVISPMGGMVSFNTTSIETHTSDGIDKVYAYDSSHNFITVDDIDIQVNTREKFRHYGATFNVAGSTFNIAIKETKNSLKFSIENERHVTSDVEGLLGFTMAQSYEIHDDGSLTINNEQMRYEYDSAEDCYRLDGSDVLMKLLKHQMNQKYILGRPIYVQLFAADTPK